MKIDHRIQKLALPYSAFLVIGLGKNGKKEMDKVRYLFNREIPSKSFVVKGIREKGQNLKGELRSKAG